MLYYLAVMEPYYIKCIKDGLFQPKTVEGDIKPESQWTMDERRVVVQDQRLKSIIMSCLPDDIMELVISCETVKATSIDLVHSFEGPSDTKENRIMDMKLEYQTFRAKLSESLSQTYTDYKTLLNELANDGVNLSKYEINDFQENSDNEANERTSEEYLRDLDMVFHERALLANSKRFIKIRNNFSSQKANENTNYLLIKEQWPSFFTFDWDDEEVSHDEDMTKVKVLMALVDDELIVGKNHARNGEWINITVRKVNILLFMDEDADWQNYLKYINVDLNFHFSNSKPELTKLNHALQEQLKEESKINEKWLTSSKKDLVERHNPDSKLLNFNIGRTIVPESQAVNECLKPTEASNDPESESLTPLPPLKNL
ncbi:hypothetical protein Tco_1175916 [Tanacetum coccineum]